MSIRRGATAALTAVAVAAVVGLSDGRFVAEVETRPATKASVVT